MSVRWYRVLPMNEYQGYPVFYIMASTPTVALLQYLEKQGIAFRTITDDGPAGRFQVEKVFGGRFGLDYVKLWHFSVSSGSCAPGAGKLFMLDLPRV